jgi:uncharacterized RDD family membrane protein YckC
MKIDRLMRAPVEVAARSSRTLFDGELERAVERLVAGPLPELVARAVVEQRVVERIVHSDPEVPRTAEQLARRLVKSSEFEAVLSDLLESPALRKAMAHQAVGFGAELATSVRERAARLDDRVERIAHRVVRADPPAASARRYAGVVTRLAAFVVDAVLVQAVFLVGIGTLALLGALVGARWHDAWVITAASAVWSLWTIAYFAGFWTTIAQTPGERLLGVRVVARDGRPPSVLRALARVVWIVIAVAPFLLGLLPALFDGRRRAVQDFVTGTTLMRVTTGASA